jgi:serine/threonine protein phosphatase PrpC
MHPFQDSLQTWFSRKLPSRSQNKCSDFPLFLSSDIGLVRKENQDRVAAIHTGKNSVNPILAIAVADGMGGMRDGGVCSTMALSGFFYALIHHRNLALSRRAEESIRYANEFVYDRYSGNGGSTLTAILIDENLKSVLVHLGDSRIYTFRPHGKVERKTVDDSLAEAVGGTGRELLQFVGMGESMRAKIADFPIDTDSCAITTDGIHGIGEDTLHRILENSSDIEQASLRLSALSRWFGGHDNSTSAMIDLRGISEALSNYQGSGIRLWDAHGDLVTLWLRDENPATIDRQPPSSDNDAETKKRGGENKEASTSSEERARAKKKSRPDQKRKKKENGSSDSVQLDIEIGSSEDQGESGADSK